MQTVKNDTDFLVIAKPFMRDMLRSKSDKGIWLGTGEGLFKFGCEFDAPIVLQYFSTLEGDPFYSDFVEKNRNENSVIVGIDMENQIFLYADNS